MTTAKETHFNAPVRNCRNCVHRHNNGWVDECVRTGTTCSIAVLAESLCGERLRFWQPKPPRRSLRRWLFETLWK